MIFTSASIPVGSTISLQQHQRRNGSPSGSIPGIGGGGEGRVVDFFCDCKNNIPCNCCNMMYICISGKNYDIVYRSLDKNMLLGRHGRRETVLEDLLV